ncbi:MAG: SMP-30/gluconolactonase/LRE family protein [Comamonadaceae bacterium]|nr:MAG: SMP-30/gluconolactonase/LRE family protein [Comamonadaceae bacterium]
MTPNPDPRIAFDAQAVLGECVLWCERSASLFWTDIESQTLHRWWPDTGASARWPMPERLGSFALCESPDRLLLGLASGVALFDLATGRPGELLPVEADRPTTRINDGRCDRQGRFVFGTFNRSREGGAIGGFHRVATGHGRLLLEALPLPPVRVANGIAFSPDGTTMYFADSPTSEIRCVDYGDRLGEPRSFARFAPGDGFPDGATVDADGGLWSAHWDGGCVVRRAPDGSESRRIALPVTRPTCTAFGGPALDTLYLSTARVGLAGDQLAGQPAAGAILGVPGAWRGLPEARFAA